jgi:hypothetical protein
MVGKAGQASILVPPPAIGEVMVKHDFNDMLIVSADSGGLTDTLRLPMSQ